jgi:iron complex outermembrane receptor protein
MVLPLSLALGAGWAESLVAQAPAPSGPPTLPPTVIQGTPPTTPAPTPEPQPEPPPPETPVDQSPQGPFGSPPADGYRAGSATTGTIINVPLISYPGSLQVVTPDMIHDQSIFSLDDAIRDIGGANKTPDFRRPDAFTIRGFLVNFTDFRKDGFRDPTQAPRDFSNIQRIEILEGPSSVLYGGGQPSGVVNFITKQPVNDTFIRSNYTGGNYDFNRVTVDANTPLTADGSLLFRLNFAYENDGSFRDFGFDHRVFVAPAFSWVVDDNTRLVVRGEYLRDQRSFDSGIAVFNNSVNTLPISESLNEPTDFERFEDFRVSAILTHKFNDDWAVKFGANALWNRNPFFGHQPFSITPATPFGPNTIIAPIPGLGPTPVSLAPGATSSEVPRMINVGQDFGGRYVSVIGDLNGKVDTWGLKHNLLLGSELGFFHSSLNGFDQDVGLSPQLIDVINPVYYQPLPPASAFTGNGFFPFAQYQYGIYGQDYVELTEHLKFLAGVRGDIVRTDSIRQFTLPTTLNGSFFGFPFQVPIVSGFPRTQTVGQDYRLTPRFGLIYEPIKEVLSAYVAYSESFDPGAGFVTASPTPPKPEIGRTYEAGIKADLLDKHLSLTFAGFHIIKDNVIEQDPITFLNIQIGQERSEGVEFTATGKLTEVWSIIANYTYLDTKVNQDANTAFVGQRILGVPYNTFNLWTRYNLIQNDDQTFGVAGGMVYNGKRIGDQANTFQLPDYARFDAGIYYTRHYWNAQVYFENIFDRRYYTGSLSNLEVFPGAPFTVKAQVGVTF